MTYDDCTHCHKPLTVEAETACDACRRPVHKTCAVSDCKDRTYCADCAWDLDMDCPGHRFVKCDYYEDCLNRYCEGCVEQPYEDDGEYAVSLCPECLVSAEDGMLDYRYQW